MSTDFDTIREAILYGQEARKRSPLFPRAIAALDRLESQQPPAPAAQRALTEEEVERIASWWAYVEVGHQQDESRTEWSQEDRDHWHTEFGRIITFLTEARDNGYLTHPSQQELIRAGDAMRVCELLASAWHYGKMKFETPCEEEMKVLLESLGLWPTTEDEIVARSQRAAKQSSPSQPASTEPRLTVERAMDAVDAEPELPDDMPDEMWEACRSDRATMQEALRVAVRLTKEGINDRISKTATGN